MDIDVRVEAAFGSGYTTLRDSMAWRDLSPYVEGDQDITITAARRDEKSVADANECRLTLDNRDGRFTPGYASGAYYPDIKKGVPLRVVVRWPVDDANWIANYGFETDVAGWQAYGLGYGGGSVARSTARAFSGAASALVTWPTFATASFIGTGTYLSDLVIGRTYTLSFYAYVPAGSPDVRAAVGYTSAGAWLTTKDAWVRISHTFTATSSSHVVGVEATNTTAGQQVYIDLVMLDEGDTVSATFTSAAPDTVLTTRFFGYVDEWPVEWPLGTGHAATSTIVAHSYLARLARGTALRSLIEEEVLYDGPEFYYTFAEAQGATTAADSSANDREPLAIVQRGSGGTVEFGSATGPDTDDLTAVTFTRSTTDTGKYLYGAYSTPLNTSGDLYAYLEVWANVSVSGAYLATVRTANLLSEISLYTSGLGELTADVDIEGGGFAEITTTAGVDGATHHLLVKMERATTSSYLVSLWVDGVQQGSPVSVSAPWAGSDPLMPIFDRVYVGGTAWQGSMLTGTLAHLAFYAGTTAIDTARWTEHKKAGLDGFADEYAGDRISRLVRYAGPAALDKLATPPAYYGDQVALQRTGGSTVIDMLRQVELTDGGVLYDAADGYLTYVERAVRYNATSAFTFDTAAQVIESDLRVVLDDAYLENDVSGTRPGGTVTVRLVDTDSRDTYGPYATSYDTLTRDDNSLRDLVAWRLYLYAQPAPRLPAAATELVTQADTTIAACLALDVGTKVTLSNLPSQAPASSLEFFVEGYTETIRAAAYRMALNLSPAEAFVVWELDDTTLSVLGTTTRLAF